MVLKSDIKIDVNLDVIKIDNPQEFIKDLLNTFKNEKKD